MGNADLMIKIISTVKWLNCNILVNGEDYFDIQEAIGQAMNAWRKYKTNIISNLGKESKESDIFKADISKIEVHQINKI